jgi:hypothetical protein
LFKHVRVRPAVFLLLRQWRVRVGAPRERCPVFLLLSSRLALPPESRGPLAPRAELSATTLKPRTCLCDDDDDPKDTALRPSHDLFRHKKTLSCTLRPTTETFKSALFNKFSGICFLLTNVDQQLAQRARARFTTHEAKMSARVVVKQSARARTRNSQSHTVDLWHARKNHPRRAAWGAIYSVYCRG